MTYDKRAHGTPDASDLKQAVNLLKLFDSDDSNLIDLASYILAPTHPEVSYPMEAPGISDTFPTSLCWELFTDDNDGAKAIGEFRRIYIGALRPNTEKELLIRRVNPRIRYEFDIVDISKLVLESVASHAIANFFLARMAFTDYEPSTTGESGCFYDVVYRHSGVNYARCLDRRGPGFDKARYWPLASLFMHMRILCDAVFCAYLRTSFVETSPKFRYIAYPLAGEPTFAIEDGHPMDFVKFFRQSYLKSGVRGITEITRGELCFMGVIWDDNVDEVDQSFDDAYNGTLSGGGLNFTGGFLINHSDKSSIYSDEMPNLWDFFKRYARGLTRAQFRHTENGINFEFNLLNDAVDTTITLEDLGLLPTSDATVRMTSRVVTGTNVAIPAGLGEDSSSASYKTGSRAEDEEQCTVVFHNSPTVGEGGNRYQFGPASTDRNPDLINPFLAGASTGYNPLVLCYFDTPTDISINRIPIRPADQVYIATEAGFGGNIDGDITELPAPTLPVDPKLFDELFWLPMMAALRHARATSCLPYSMAYRLSKIYGSQKQWLLEEPVRFSTLIQRTLGDRFYLLDPFAGGGLNMLTNNRTIFDSYPLKPILTRAKFDISTGKTETELLANP